MEPTSNSDRLRAPVPGKARPRSSGVPQPGFLKELDEGVDARPKVECEPEAADVTTQSTDRRNEVLPCAGSAPELIRHHVALVGSQTATSSRLLRQKLSASRQGRKPAGRGSQKAQQTVLLPKWPTLRPPPQRQLRTARKPGRCTAAPFPADRIWRALAGFSDRDRAAAGSVGRRLPARPLSGTPGDWRHNSDQRSRRTQR
jgi:hypothetical protein